MKPFIPSKAAEFTFALVIGFFAVIHFLNFDGLKDFVPAYASADHEVWIFITGIPHLFAAVCIITGWNKTFACYLLALMLLIFVFAIHLPALDNARNKAKETVFLMNLLKDTAMAACAILVGNRKDRKKVVKKSLKDLIID